MQFLIPRLHAFSLSKELFVVIWQLKVTEYSSTFVECFALVVTSNHRCVIRVKLDYQAPQDWMEKR